jgi:hypothetical protein
LSKVIGKKSKKSKRVPLVTELSATDVTVKSFNDEDSEAEEGKLIGDESKIVAPELKLSKVIGKKSKKSKRVPLVTDLSTTDVTVKSLNDKDSAC